MLASRCATLNCLVSCSTRVSASSPRRGARGGAYPGVVGVHPRVLGLDLVEHLAHLAHHVVLLEHLLLRPARRAPIVDGRRVEPPALVAPVVRVCAVPGRRRVLRGARLALERLGLLLALPIEGARTLERALLVERGAHHVRDGARALAPQARELLVDGGLELVDEPARERAEHVRPQRADAREARVRARLRGLRRGEHARERGPDRAREQLRGVVERAGQSARDVRVRLRLGALGGGARGVCVGLVRGAAGAGSVDAGRCGEGAGTDSARTRKSLTISSTRRLSTTYGCSARPGVAAGADEDASPAGGPNRVGCVLCGVGGSCGPACARSIDGGSRGGGGGALAGLGDCARRAGPPP
jgi:hypothetical protein